MIVLPHIVLVAFRLPTSPKFVYLFSYICHLLTHERQQIREIHQVKLLCVRLLNTICSGFYELQLLCCLELGCWLMLLEVALEKRRLRAGDNRGWRQVFILRRHQNAALR